MKRKIPLLSCLMVMMLAMTSTIWAQLIDHNRRSKYEEESTANSTPQKAATTSRNGYSQNTNTAAASGLPSWKTTEPTVAQSSERRYDLNKDGKLQIDEVSAFLKDVIKKVDDRGSYTIDSDIVKTYDANADGLISRYEANAIKTHVK